MNPIDTVARPRAQLSRRGFLAVGGALIVTASCSRWSGGDNSLDAANPVSWIEIHADNTVTMRTGKCDFGQSSIYTAYRQIVAEELGVPLEAVTNVISGDTDRTPDGGGTFGLMFTNVLNLRKVAAYTREAALDLAAERFGVPRAQVSVADGVFSGGGRSAAYGELVAGQDLRLTIPVSGELTGFAGLTVEGDPPLKATSEYTIVGQPARNPIIPPKISGETTWVGDVKLPGMLHARVIHPATLGSTLVSAGAVDAEQFPNARVVVVGNIVGVVAPDEWEAIQAAQQVAADTTWTEWSGLPGHERLLDHLRSEVDWSEVPASDGRANTGDAAVAGAARSLEASYFVPFHKHAPISPMVSVADVKRDGSVTLHTHSQNPQFLRRAIAMMLGEPESKVVIRTYPGASHFGRSNGGNAGSEDEAVLLSRAVRAPVRVQWMRAEDLQWSTQSPPVVSDIRIALDGNGRIMSYAATHSMPPGQDDRAVGAVLAGLPAIDAPWPENPSRLHGTSTFIADAWVYDQVSNVHETGRGTYQIGQRESAVNVGLRGHSLRTPGQYQQNFGREIAINEAAALAGADPIQFRINHTSEERFKTILARLREESGWRTRPSPAPGARATGSGVLRGQGVAMMTRSRGYWACACHIEVIPETGAVRVARLTIVVDPGIVVNPLQLKRQVEAGSLMGVSQALHEEVMFDAGAVTSVDWFSYPILTMAEAPEVKVVIAARPEVGVYGQGSETANALAMPAIASAFFDATGKPARRIPLKPDYVKAMLSA